jgi:hypothetical protein
VGSLAARTQPTIRRGTLGRLARPGRRRRVGGVAVACPRPHQSRDRRLVHLVGSILSAHAATHAAIIPCTRSSSAMGPISYTCCISIACADR